VITRWRAIRCGKDIAQESARIDAQENVKESGMSRQNGGQSVGTDCKSVPTRIKAKLFGGRMNR
jgi:hypothetical protein